MGGDTEYGAREYSAFSRNLEAGPGTTIGRMGRDGGIGRARGDTAQWPDGRRCRGDRGRCAGSEHRAALCDGGPVGCGGGTPHSRVAGLRPGGRPVQVGPGGRATYPAGPAQHRQGGHLRRLPAPCRPCPACGWPAGATAQGSPPPSPSARPWPPGSPAVPPTGHDGALAGPVRPATRRRAPHPRALAVRPLLRPRHRLTGNCGCKALARSLCGGRRMYELLVDELVDPQRPELAADTGSLGAAKR